MLISPKLRANVIGSWGSKGEHWLSQLPDILEQCKQLWDLKIEPSKFELSYNYVTLVRLPDGTEAVLKVGVPNEELAKEIDALSVFDDRLAVKLLKYNKSLGALLLERIDPGKTLTSIQQEDDERATILAVELLTGLPVNVPEGVSFPAIEDWVEVFPRIKELNGSPMPPSMITKAERVLQEFSQDRTARQLVHGDLHHENILYDSQRGWLCIDPKGVIADPIFNAARFLNDPRPRLVEMESPARVIERRLEILSAAFQTEKRRLAGWAYVDCVISACWWIDSGANKVSYSLRCAELFDAYL